MKKLIYKIVALLPLQKVILFESNPELGCNTYPVYQYMMDRHWNKGYKLVWLVKDKRKFKNVHTFNNRFINSTSRNVIDLMSRIIYKRTAKCLISSNDVLIKYRKEQLAIFLCHGSKGKKTRGIYEVGDEVDYVLCQADFFKEVTSYEYNVSLKKLVCLGYPRNDYLFQNKDVLSAILPSQLNISKTIVWLPTWRHHKCIKDDYGANKNGIPLLTSIEVMKQLNNYLKVNNIVIILKPHPAQDVSGIKENSLSNFILIDDAFLSSKQVHLYEVLAQSDALLTDYSSVFFDYLLIDKPIGLTVDDLHEYSDKRGFAYDIETVHQAGFKIHTLEDLYQFVSDLLYGRDELTKEREEIRNLTNFYQDGNSTARVVGFISEKLGGEGM